MQIVEAAAQHQYILAFSGDQPPPEAGGLWCGHIGRFHSRGGFSNRNLVDAWVLHVVLAGRGTVGMAGHDHEVGPASLFALLPGVPATYADTPDTPWRYWWLRFQGDAAAAWFARRGISERRPVRAFQPEALPNLGAVIEDGHDLLSRRGHDRLAVCTVAWRLAAALDLALGIDPGEPASPESLARAHLDAKFHTDISIADLAAAVGLDRTTLFRRFRAAFACSPLQYLARRRAEAARRLSRHPDLPPDEIARLSGFPSVRSLRAALRRSDRPSS